RRIITGSEELKFLVGFFYFSGWKDVYESIKANPGLRVKLLIGLQVDQLLSRLSTVVEHGGQEPTLSRDDIFQQFMTSMSYAINNEEMDTEPFYNQVTFFLDMLETGRLEIAKTAEPSHAKLYLFKYNEEQNLFTDRQGEFITGSSNLTKAGLEGQEEFNVEIRDYGFDDAEKYFDELWENAVKITEEEDRKTALINFIRNKSQAASVEPYEAYALVLKTYLDLQARNEIRPDVEKLLELNGFEKYSYQLDAVNQALSIIQEYNGAIIADVVGLGKSVIASLIAKNMGMRGVVICPPGLIGDQNKNTGWYEYLNRFKLHDWEVHSRGKLEELSNSLEKDTRDIEMVIVDEAHYFRNQDTEAYEQLLNICRDKIVILLTATPFNNSPADIFSLLKLFIVPGKSGITIEDNMEATFRSYEYRFRYLSYILKNYNSRSGKKRAKAEKYYVQLVGGKPPVNIELVKEETSAMAAQIKQIIAPVVIRRNRLDLKTDYQYSKEIQTLGEIADPKELFFELSKKQSEFYDKVINTYFGEDGLFKGAIYQPFVYEKQIDEDKLDEAGNRAFQQQQNLFEFMRRLLVKRFESSFGAFNESIKRFKHIHEVVQKFIKKSGQKYILDRKLIESVYKGSEEDIEQALIDFEKSLSQNKTGKNDRVYNINKFEYKDDFHQDIEKDRKLFDNILQEIEDLDLVNTDPKRENVLLTVNDVLKRENRHRKVIIFTEYVDTVKHLQPYFEEKMQKRVLFCDGKVTKKMQKQLYSNFDAQYNGKQEDEFDLLITSDKLSEGFNLNRAGVIINYDIPWNPTRVIQRVGRINRIGKKVFDELFIFNFFPSEKGADVVKSRQIAAQKMFLIHRSLGEDAKIFDQNEEPAPSELFSKINKNPEDEQELNIVTVIRNRFEEIKKHHPEVIEKINNLPARVKTAKPYQSSELNVLRKKGLGMFAQQIRNNEQESLPKEIHNLQMEELLKSVECNIDTKKLNLSASFWENYEAIKNYKPAYKSGRSEISLEVKAHNNLKMAYKFIRREDEQLRSFIQILIKDIRHYHTLSDYTLGRIGRFVLKQNSSQKQWDRFFDEIRYIRQMLGHDYLDRTLERLSNQKLEVIIAVENLIEKQRSI
ncbi:MAG: helicase-related protein, partial [Bacteroidales bacterium]